MSTTPANANGIAIIDGVRLALMPSANSAAVGLGVAFAASKDAFIPMIVGTRQINAITKAIVPARIIQLAERVEDLDFADW